MDQQEFHLPFFNGTYKLKFYPILLAMTNAKPQSRPEPLTADQIRTFQNEGSDVGGRALIRCPQVIPVYLECLKPDKMRRLSKSLLQNGLMREGGFDDLSRTPP